VRCVHEAIGPDVKLMLDMNAPYDAAGFTESLRIAHYAEMRGVTIAPHSALHVHAHLVSAFGDAAFGAESIGDHGRH
jgi:L-alanine-DL-glutamate epimerase-like enolase superfamily enzyme